MNPLIHCIAQLPCLSPKFLLEWLRTDALSCRLSFPLRPYSQFPSPSVATADVISPTSQASAFPYTLSSNRGTASPSDFPCFARGHNLNLFVFGSARAQTASSPKSSRIFRSIAHSTHSLGPSPPPLLLVCLLNRRHDLPAAGTLDVFSPQ